MKLKVIVPILLLSLGVSMQAMANQIKKVFVVDAMTLEVVMKEPLSKEETNPQEFLSSDYKSTFAVNQGAEVIGPPVPQQHDGVNDNVYRITVNGLEEGPIYQISYKGQKPKTFKVYDEMTTRDKYRDRYGSYF